jgi:hypothetical protein
MMNADAGLPPPGAVLPTASGGSASCGCRWWRRYSSRVREGTRAICCAGRQVGVWEAESAPSRLSARCSDQYVESRGAERSRALIESGVRSAGQGGEDAPCRRNCWPSTATAALGQKHPPEAYVAAAISALMSPD